MADSRGEAGRRRRAAFRSPRDRPVVVSASGLFQPPGWAREALPRGEGRRFQVRELRTEIPYDGRIKIAAQVPPFEPSAHIEAGLLPFCDPFTQFAVIAADEAMAQAGLGRDDVAGPRTAVIIGTGIGGMTPSTGVFTAITCSRPVPTL